MAFQGGSIPANTPTGGWQTQVVLDGKEYISVEDAWGGARYSVENGAFAKTLGMQNSRFSRYLTAWLSGCITTAPMPQFYDQQKDVPTGTYDMRPGGGGIIGVLTAAAVAGIKLAVYNQPTLTGLSAQPGTKPSGGLHFQRSVASGDSWLQSGSVLAAPPSVAATNAVLAAPPTILAPAPVVAPPTPAYQGPTQLFTPVAQADNYAPADQSFQISFLLPGSAFTSPDAANCFAFGGVNGGNDFQYFLYFDGDGMARLFEYAQAAQGGSFSSYYRATFPYCRPQEVPNRLHQITIFPHVGPNGEKYISFRTANRVPNVLTTGDGSKDEHEFLYKWDALTAGTVDGSPNHATGAGKWYVQERADLRHQFQVRRTVWQPYGEMIDTTWELPLWTADRSFQTSRVAFIPDPDGTNPTPDLVLSLHDADSQAIVTTAGQATSGGVYPSFQFFGAFTQALIFWGYTLYLPPVNQLVAPGAITPPVETVSIKGGESDPRRESGGMSLDGADAAYPRLANRGSLPVRVQVRIPSTGGGGGTTYTNVVLARGYVSDPHRTRKGQPNRHGGLAGDGPLVASPAAEWSHYELTFAGMWERLSRVSTKSALTPKFFAFDPNAVANSNNGTGLNGTSLLAYKITDIVRFLISRAGFPDEMINIQDLPIRIMPGIGVEIGDFILDANDSIADLIVKILRNYLGYSLIFDPNAGMMVMDTNGDTEGAPIGQWMLLGAPADNAPPVAHFVTGVPAAASGATAFWSPDALPPNTVYSQGDLESWTRKPEGNVVRALTLVNAGKQTRVKITNECYNPYSYPAPGFTGITLDPDGPHYLGYEQPIFFSDATLWGGDGANGLQYTQNAVDFVVRRIFQVSCLPRKIQPVSGRLLFITDADSGRLRPLRFYDPVTFNGESGWYVRNVNPESKDSTNIQAYYELEKLIPMPVSGIGK